MAFPNPNDLDSLKAHGDEIREDITRDRLERRGRWIVNRAFQGRILVRAVAVCVPAMCLPIAAAAFLPSMGAMGVAMATAASLCVVLAMTVVMSGRVAGSLVRLERILRASARPEQIRALEVRRSDYFPELIRAYNDLAERARPALVLYEQGKAAKVIPLRKPANEGRGSSEAA